MVAGLRDHPQSAELGREELLARVVDACDDALFVVDLDGTLMSWNAAAERSFGYGADEVLGRGIDLLVPPERRGELDEELERARRGERTAGRETTRIGKGGRAIEVTLTVSPLRDSAGRPIAALCVAREPNGWPRAGEEDRQLLASI